MRAESRARPRQAETHSYDPVGAVNLYRDGALVGWGNQSQGSKIFKGGSFVIGQEQDTVGGTFDDSQKWTGRLSRVRS